MGIHLSIFLKEVVDFDTRSVMKSQHLAAAVLWRTSSPLKVQPP